MTKFHINKHGVPAPCRAKKGNCPLGGEENHFKSAEEAQSHINKTHESHYSLMSGMNEVNPFHRDNLERKFPQLGEEDISNLEKYLEYEEISEKTVKNMNDNPNKHTEEYFNSVQEHRERELAKYALHKKLKVTDDELKEIIDEKIETTRGHNDAPWYNFKEMKPRIQEGDNSFRATKEVISAYTGKSKEEVEREIRDLMKEKGLDLHEANQEYWKKAKKRTDKPFVSLDLETANPVNDKALQYDEGQSTHIIELGAIKTYPDGRVEKLDIMYGVPKEFEERHGAGFSNFHNIQVEDIQGKAEFTRNPENQKKIMEFLDGSVIMAHNAYFEEKQLTSSLRGFGGKVHNGDIEMICTRNYTRFFLPDTERNSNKDLTEAAGLKYEGAHRALQDATMTLDAFNILTKNK